MKSAHAQRCQEVTTLRDEVENICPTIHLERYDSEGFLYEGSTSRESLPKDILDDDDLVDQELESLRRGL